MTSNVTDGKKKKICLRTFLFTDEWRMITVSVWIPVATCQCVFMRTRARVCACVCMCVCSVM